VSRLINQERVLIVSQKNRVLYFDVCNISGLKIESHYGQHGEVYIMYDKGTYSYNHTKGCEFLFKYLNEIIIDLKIGKKTSAIVEIDKL